MMENKAFEPFDALFCVGQFFAQDARGIREVRDYIFGKKYIPIPTYFIGDYGEEADFLLSRCTSTAEARYIPSGAIPIRRNLTWLKGSGIVDIHGLRIAYLGGTLHEYAGSGLSAAIARDDVNLLLAHAHWDGDKTTDIFLSNEWPQGVILGIHLLQELQEVPSCIDSTSGSQVVAKLAAALRPRYHFAGTEGVHFARAPFTVTGNRKSHCSYFFGLAAVDNEQQQRFLKGLTLMPADLSSLLDPRLEKDYPLTTISPFELPRLKYSDHDVRSKATNATFKAGVEIIQSGRKALPKLGATGMNHMASASTSGPEERDTIYWQFMYHKGDLEDMLKFPLIRQKTAADDSSGTCHEFVATGMCSDGSTCALKHEIYLSKLQMEWCPTVLKSRCTYGSECHLRHLTEDDHCGGEPKSSTRGTCLTFSKTKACQQGAECRFIHYFGHPFKHPPPISSPSNNACRLCLGELQKSKHEAFLLISVGEFSYCALSRELIRVGQETMIPVILLSPILHIPAMASTPTTTWAEICELKQALRCCLETYGNTTIAFEVYIQQRVGTYKLEEGRGRDWKSQSQFFQSNETQHQLPDCSLRTHAQLEVFLIPTRKSATIRKQFESAAKKSGFKFWEILPGKPYGEIQEAVKGIVQGQNYYYVELPDETILISPFDGDGDGTRSDQFGKEVVASILNEPSIPSWYIGTVSEDRYRRLSKSIREKFESFDPARMLNSGMNRLEDEFSRLLL